MRRIIAFVMLLFAFSACAAAETFTINTKNGCAVVDDDGEMRFDCSNYSVIFPLKNEDDVLTGYAAGIRTQDETVFYALLSPGGARLTRHSYTYIKAAGMGFIAAIRDDWYCLTSRGAVVGKGYSDIEYIGGAAFAVHGDPYDEIADDLVLLHPGGYETPTDIEIQYGLNEFSEGLMAVTSGKNLLAGYINAEAQWIIDPTYTYAGDFENGLAVAAKKNGYGVIDASGSEIIPFEFSFIARTGDKFCAVKDDAAYILGPDGQIISKTALHGASVQISDDCLIIAATDETRVQTASGVHLFTVASGLYVESCGDLFIIRSASGAYVADREGLAVSAEYDIINHMDGEIFAYGQRDAAGNAQYGLLRASDGEITGCRYDSISLLQPGLYAVSSGSNLFLMEETGHTIPVR